MLEGSRFVSRSVQEFLPWGEGVGGTRGGVRGGVARYQGEDGIDYDALVTRLLSHDRLIE